jgi:hypothetical protein
MPESLLRPSTVRPKKYKLPNFVKPEGQPWTEADEEELQRFYEQESKLFHTILKEEFSLTKKEDLDRRRKQERESSVIKYESVYNNDSTRPKVKKVRFDLDEITEHAITFRSPQEYQQYLFAKFIALFEAKQHYYRWYPEHVIEDLKAVVNHFFNYDLQPNFEYFKKHQMHPQHEHLSVLSTRLSVLFEVQLRTVAPEDNYDIVTSITLTLTAIYAKLECWGHLDYMEETKFSHWQHQALLTTKAKDTLRKCGYFDIVNDVCPMYLADSISTDTEDSGWNQAKLDQKFEETGEDDFTTPSFFKQKRTPKPFQWSRSCEPWRHSPPTFTIHVEVNSLHGDVLRLSRNIEPQELEKVLVLKLSDENACNLECKRHELAKDQPKKFKNKTDFTMAMTFVHKQGHRPVSGLCTIKPALVDFSSGKVQSWIGCVYKIGKVNSSKPEKSLIDVSLKDEDLKDLLTEYGYKLVHFWAEECKYKGVLCLYDDTSLFKAFLKGTFCKIKYTHIRPRAEAYAADIKGDGFQGIYTVPDVKQFLQDAYDIQVFPARLADELENRRKSHNFNWYKFPPGAKVNKTAEAEYEFLFPHIEIQHKASLEDYDSAKKAALEAVMYLEGGKEKIPQLEEQFKKLNPTKVDHYITILCSNICQALGLKTVRINNCDFDPFNPFPEGKNISLVLGKSISAFYHNTIP